MALSPSYVQVTPLSGRVLPVAQRAADVSMSQPEQGWKAAGLAAALALATGVQSASAGPFTRSEIASLTYEQIKEGYPTEFEARSCDKLNYRYPGAGGCLPKA